jgi:hypothetical protein
MKHTTKMLLIPEEVYRALMLMGNSSSSNVGDIGQQADASAALESTQAKMQRELQDKAKKSVSFSMDKDGDGGDDARQIHFTGAFKRYQKLRKEERERPANVSVRNIPEVEAAVKRALPSAPPPQNSSNNNRRNRNASRSTRSSSVSSRSTSASTLKGSEATAEESERQEEEQETLDEPTHPSTSSNQNETAANDYFATPERKQKRYDAVLAFVQDHAGELGLSDQLQPLRQLHGERVPVKTSNIHNILDYHFSSPHQRVQRQPPAGYTAFTQMARKNQFLSDRMFTPQAVEKSPMRLRPKVSDSNNSKPRQTKMGGKGGHIKGPTQTIFKPELW